MLQNVPWMKLVTACRQSGLTDADWCAEHGIAPSSFYNAVTRLRKQACQIPDPIKKTSTLDLTSRKQDVIRIAIEPENSSEELLPNPMDSSMYLDNSYTIEIEINGLLIRLSNSVQPSLLNLLVTALRHSQQKGERPEPQMQTVLKESQSPEDTLIFQMRKKSVLFAIPH